MKLYIDDDTVEAALIQGLRKLGHDVEIPSDVGLAGSLDAVHFRQAIHEGRVLLSRNYDDFQALHHLVMEAQGHHHGVLLVRLENDRKRDMKASDIVRAIGNLETSGISLSDELQYLNHWR